MSVMFFGGPDGLMAEQLLHGANVGSVGQQFDREGVAEPVRVGVNPGELPYPGNRTPKAFGAIVGVPVSAPEKVRRVSAGRGQRLERRDCIRMEKHLQRYAGLGNANHEMAAGFQSSAAEAGNVPHPEAGIQQRQDQRPSAAPDHRPILLPHGLEAVASGDQLVDFIFAKRQGGNVIDPWGPNELRRILLAPSLFDAPSPHRPQVLDLFPVGSRRDIPACVLPAVHVRLNRSHIYTLQRARPEPIAKVLQRLRVAADAARLEFPARAVFQERISGLRQGSRRGDLDANVHAALHGVYLRGRAVPTSRCQGASESLAVQRPVTPDGTVAEGVIPSLRDVIAGFQVAAMQCEHGLILPRGVTPICNVGFGLSQGLYFVCDGMGWAEGFEPLSLPICPWIAVFPHSPEAPKAPKQGVRNARYKGSADGKIERADRMRQHPGGSNRTNWGCQSDG